MAKAGREGALTRQSVLEAALRLIDEEGLAGFSMRKLGAKLGVEAMSLYNHVANKDALFDGLIEMLLVQTPYPDLPDATPYAELWAFSHAYYAVLRSHPHVLPLVATRQVQTPAALAVLERLLTAIHRAHIQGVQAIYTLNNLAGYLIGHALLDVGITPGMSASTELSGPQAWQRLPAEQFPTLRASVPDLEQWNADQELDAGLRALLQCVATPETVA